MNNIISTTRECILYINFKLYKIKWVNNYSKVQEILLNLILLEFKKIILLNQLLIEIL